MTIFDCVLKDFIDIINIKNYMIKYKGKIYYPKELNLLLNDLRIVSVDKDAIDDMYILSTVRDTVWDIYQYYTKEYPDIEIIFKSYRNLNYHNSNRNYVLKYKFNKVYSVDYLRKSNLICITINDLYEENMYE